MWKKLLKYRRIAATFTKVEVHNGVSTSFWFDDCSDQGRLIDKTWDGGVINMGIRLHGIRPQLSGNTVEEDIELKYTISLRMRYGACVKEV